MFALDSKFYRFCEVLFRIVVANLMFMLTSLPLVTFGASLNALLRTLREEETKIVAPYFRYFKESLFITLPLVGFNFFSLSFFLMMQQNVLFSESMLLKLVFSVFTIFLVTYNLNLYLIQLEFKKGQNYVTLFKTTFIFSLGFFYKVVWIPMLFGIAYYLLYPYASLLINLIFLSAPICCYQWIFLKGIQSND